MKATDSRLSIVANAARVRPPHVHFVVHAMKELGEAFCVESVALMAQLEAKYVQAIVDALTARDWLPSKPRAVKVVKASSSRLPAGFQPPPEWAMYAREKRFWTPAEVAEELEGFADHFHKTGQAYADWLAAWRGWVRRSRRPNGTHSPHVAVPTETPLEYHERQAAFYDKIGNQWEAGEHRAKADKLRGNVVPIKRALQSG